MPGVVGLDLSVANTGACFIPGDWSGRREDIETELFPTKKGKATYGKPKLESYDLTRRALEIADKIVIFVKRHGVRDIALEGYAYSKGRGKKGGDGSSSVTKLAEVVGVVKSQLVLSCSVPAVPIQPNSARKIVVGSLRRSDQKEQVKRILEGYGFVFETLDEMDAFVVCYAHYCMVNEVESCFLRG